ncbi:hypothetical protein [Neisseria iguanae]|uniref:Uncharacterized protein n=1 Tax=Neisseria iguanae TaxID=90242 RepID=A0A2P7TZU6_9NEIS|nr:hypothetical protein [Neisseria iguanae]PSJ80163.1 hypothetical protein C7N83_07940 [Neisseria iguanae]
MLIEENTAQTAAAITAYRRGVIEAGGQMWHQPIVLRSDVITLMTDKRPPESQISDFFQTAS